MNLNRNKIEKILLIKPRGIGDVVLSTIILKNIKEFFPDAVLDYATEKPSNLILQNLDYINQVIMINARSLSGKLNTINTIRKNRYDLVIDLYCNPFTAQLTFFSFAKFRVGFPYRGRSYAYNIKGPLNVEQMHSAELNLELIKVLDIPVICKDIVLNTDSLSEEFADSFFYSLSLNRELIVGISPSGGWESKRINPVNFVRFINSINKRFNSRFIIFWGPGDLEDAEFIHKNCKEISYLIPKTNILQMAAIIKKCNIFIANDSGPMHISAALNTPTIGIFGPTDPLLQGPFGKNHSFVQKRNLSCIICNHRICPTNQECFNEISDEEFITVFNETLLKNGISGYEKS